MISVLKQKIQTYFADQQNILAAVLTLVLLGVGSWRAFNWYQVGQQVQAHAALVEVLHDFKIAAYLGKKWDEAELSALTGYRRFGSTKIAPYFLALQAQALAMQNKFEDGLSVFKDAVSRLKTTDPLYHSYQLQIALMAIDTKNPESVAFGVEALERFVSDHTFPLRDEALYRLAVQLLLSGKYQEAAKHLKTLVAEYPSSKANASVWADYAREKFSGIVGSDLNVDAAVSE